MIVYLHVVKPIQLQFEHLEGADDPSLSSLLVLVLHLTKCHDWHDRGSDYLHSVVPLPDSFHLAWLSATSFISVRTK